MGTYVERFLLRDIVVVLQPPRSSPKRPGGLRHIRYLLYIYDVNYLRKHCCCDAGGGIEREARTKKRGLEGTGCIALFTVNYVVASCDRNLVLVASGLGGIR